ncbi:MAG: hypothetical protein LIO53_05820 [Oscillospiraceae bacterium]|nr:hypothetical protein [Oscillospiraceae bacterium]
MIKYKDYLFTDFPEMGKITDEVREKKRGKLIIGSVRLNKGMYYTDKEKKEFKDKVLSMENAIGQ